MNLTQTDLLNLLVAQSKTDTDPSGDMTEDMGGDLTGTVQFTLRDSDGSVDRQEEHNAVVDDGRNALLQRLTQQPKTATVTFSGDGSTNLFQLPYPYRPVQSINSITVDGSGQSWYTDYAVRYETGEIYLFSAPSSGTDNVEVDVNYALPPFLWLAVGTDGSAVSDGQSALLSEASRVAEDQYTQDESAIQVSGQWTFDTSQANVSIAEAGLFNVPQTAAVTGTMFNRTTVSPTIDKSSSQSLQVSWTLSMS